MLLRESTVYIDVPAMPLSVHVHEYRTGQYSLFDLFFGLRLHNQNFKAIDVGTRKTYLRNFNDKIKEYYDDGV